MPSVLIAASDAGHSILTRVLSDYSLERTTCYSDFVNALESERFDLIALCLFFGKWEVFEVLRAARESKLNANTPRVCFRPYGAQDRLSELALQGIRRGLDMCGEHIFIDMQEEANKGPFADERIRRRLGDLLLLPQDGRIDDFARAVEHVLD